MATDGASEHGQIAEEPPLEVTARATHAAAAAGGLPAILESFQYALAQAGAPKTLQLFTSVNQRDGFDCPSCAWADPEERRARFEFCENGAKAFADDATSKQIGAAFFAQHTIADLSNKSDHWLNAQGRLIEPVVLRPGAARYEAISWEEAFALIGSELGALADPNEAVFYTSGKASNESAFLYQLFARLFGTNNLPDCSNMCHESSGAAIMQALGVGKATVTLHDLEHAECIIVIGQNPGTNHPRMLTALLHAKRNGATIIAVNPLKETGLVRFRHPQELLGILDGVKLADEFVPVRINGDMALLKGIIKSLLLRETYAPGSVLDRAFIEEYTSGFEALVSEIDAADWKSIEEQSGIPRDRINEIATMLAKSKRTVACWAMGLTQHKEAVATIRELINVLLLGGHIGRPGSGLLPVRGHSNVQGDRTMGISERMSDAFLDALASEFHFSPPRAPGYDTVEAIRAMFAARVGVFVSLGGNFLAATPDTRKVAAGIRKCSLTVGISTKLNRGHLVTGKTALILPCLGRTEADRQRSGLQFVTVENTVSAVSRSRGTLTPASSQLKSEPAIIAGIAKATLRSASPLDWDALIDDYDQVREHIARVIPGFQDFNRRIRRDDVIFYAPVAAKERVFNTESGKANFTLNVLPQTRLNAGEYLMMTIRSHDQFNTVVYGLDDRYRGIYGGRRVIFMNQEDMEAANLRANQFVDISSHFRGEVRTVTTFAVVPYDIPRRCTATYFPETNALVPLDSTADISNTPTSKSVVVTLRPTIERAF
ncbi:MAG TPA: FdhF/YdeP family oxidoreductase [Candidatus Baltobacteraceae bacterium]